MNSSLINRVYSSFRGVDYKNTKSILSRSPDALNVWKSYEGNDCIETRPGMSLIGEFGAKIYNVIFYNINDEIQVLVHCGTKLLKWNNYPNKPIQTTEITGGMNIIESKHFIFRGILFILDGLHYYEYNGTEIKEVVGTIPLTSYNKNPDGSTSIDEGLDIDLVFQPVNVLTPYRQNNFISDGESLNYQLDTTELDLPSMGLVEVTINGVKLFENIDFTVDRDKGLVKFNEAPIKDVIVEIVFRRTVAGYSDRIKLSPLIAEFDNRIFFSGNKDYPNAVFHCELNDPRYVRDTAYYECGIDLSEIKSIIPGNGVLWVFKEIEQNSSSVYYLTPTIDNTYGKIYPSVNGNVSKGCVSTGINYNDDLVYFSRDGLESIGTTNLYSEQILQHKSSLIDNKLIYDTSYLDMKLAEYNGYLMCLLGSKIYLADYRQRFQDMSVEYEWYYWELPNNITFIKEYRGELFLGNDLGQIFLLFGETDNEQEIISYWTTLKDDFDMPAYTKTTNKRGDVADFIPKNNDNIEVYTIKDGVERLQGIYTDITGHIIYKVKEKKFKDIQLKFKSNKRFAMTSCTLQGFMAGYMKR